MASHLVVFEVSRYSQLTGRRTGVETIGVVATTNAGSAGGDGSSNGAEECLCSMPYLVVHSAQVFMDSLATGLPLGTEDAFVPYQVQ